MSPPPQGGLNSNGIRTVVETYVNGTEWYRVWSDGWIEQGGCTAKNVSSATATFLKPFSNTDYIVSVSVAAYKSDSGTGGFSNYPGAVINNNTHIYLDMPSSATYATHWIARGY